MSDKAVDLYAGSQKRNFMGHPIGLPICFLTEMWERFSYYGMRALLILYLTKYHLFSSGKASMIYGAFVGLVYMLPIIGGYLSDRYLGNRKAVTFGAILLVLGHGLMAYHGSAAYMEEGVVVRDEFALNIFFLALALIITGVGFLKANITTVVGALYGPNDPRRDSGFTIFYMGLNLGAFISMLIVGYVGETYGWNYGFSIAGIGMFFGLLVFLWGQKLLDGHAEPRNPEILKEIAFAGINKETAIYLGGIGMVMISWMMMQYQELVGMLLGVSGFVMIGIILLYGFIKCTKIERERLMVVCFLIVVQAVFWALFEQQGASLTLLADQQFDKNLFGWQVKASQVQTMNTLFVVILAPLMAWVWVALSKRNMEPSTPVKFGTSLMIIGLGYIIFSWGMGLDDGNSKNFLWLAFIYFSLSLAELFLSPVGLSIVTKMSVTKIVGMVMGTWFLFMAVGNYLAGWISAIAGGAAHGNTTAELDMTATMDVYTMVGMFSMGVGVFIFLMTPFLKKRMHGIN
ncbi:MAG: peptide MFS transporter [Kordiimonadaceae bacterium]|nr:peptide MFS transporter [Kordiimonadaceae bacterium]